MCPVAVNTMAVMRSTGFEQMRPADARLPRCQQLARRKLLGSLIHVDAGLQAVSPARNMQPSSTFPSPIVCQSIAGPWGSMQAGPDSLVLQPCRSEPPAMRTHRAVRTSRLDMIGSSGCWKMALSGWGLLQKGDIPPGWDAAFVAMIRRSE
jgi:hypothetical protein